MKELAPIAALAGHFDWVQPSGFVPTLGLVRGHVPASEVRAAVHTHQQRHGRSPARKYALLEPGDLFGAYAVLRQLPRDSTSNERVELICDAGHRLVAYAMNLRKWSPNKRCKSCDVAAQRDSAIAGMSIGGGPALAARAR